MKHPLQEKQQFLREWLRFLLSESHVLRQNPALLFQQAVNQSDISTPARMAEERYQAGREKRPFFRWINKCPGASAGLMTLSGHSGPARACAFSPDGRRILSASQDKTLKIWDAETGKELIVLTGHRLGVNDCAFSPDGTRIVSASDDMTLKIWDPRTGKELATLAGHRGKINACAFSPDGFRIVSASEDRTLGIWDVFTGRQQKALFGGQRMTGCAFSPDGTLVLSSSGVWDGEEYEFGLSLWDAETGRELAALTSRSPERPAYPISPDGTRIFPVLLDYICAFSPDGALILTASASGSLCLWEAELEGFRAASEPFKHEIVSCAFSSDGSYVVSASWSEEIVIRDAVAGKLTAKPVYHEKVTACAVSRDASRILSKSFDNILILWDAAAAKILTDTTCQGGFSLSPDGSRIAYAAAGDTIRVLDARTARETGLL
jgi:WD40 repeat protein